MNYHICIIADHLGEDGDRILGEKIYHSLMHKSVWGLHPRTANRANFHKGDFLIFYLGGKHQSFLGTAVTTSVAYLDKKKSSQSLFLNPGTYSVDLKNIDVWERPKPIRPLLKQLTFIKNIEHWGPYLQGGVRKISEFDYKVIIESENYSKGPDPKKSIAETVIAFNPD